MEETKYKLTKETYQKLLIYCDRYKLEDGERFLIESKNELIGGLVPLKNFINFNFLAQMDAICFIKAIFFIKYLEEPNCGYYFCEDTDSEVYKELEKIFQDFETKNLVSNIDQLVYPSEMIPRSGFARKTIIFNLEYIEEKVNDILKKKGFVLVDKNQKFSIQEMNTMPFVCFGYGNQGNKSHYTYGFGIKNIAGTIFENKSDVYVLKREE